MKFTDPAMQEAYDSSSAGIDGFAEAVSQVSNSIREMESLLTEKGCKAEANEQLNTSYAPIGDETDSGVSGESRVRATFEEVLWAPNPLQDGKFRIMYHRYTDCGTFVCMLDYNIPRYDWDDVIETEVLKPLAEMPSEVRFRVHTSGVLPNLLSAIGKAAIL